MKIIETQTIRGQRVDVRGFDQATETADLCEAHVVEQEDNDVRRVFLRLDVLRPPLLRVLVAFGDYATKAFDFLGFYAVDHLKRGILRLGATGTCISLRATSRKRESESNDNKKINELHGHHPFFAYRLTRFNKQKCAARLLSTRGSGRKKTRHAPTQISR